MAKHSAPRRLAAIMCADVVGYSRLMGLDEVGTLKALKQRRSEVLAPLIAKYHGRLVKVMGDGVLVEFASAVNASQCALDLQHEIAKANGPLPEPKRITLRIGVNLGDVIVEGSDIYGDGVNVAVRLETVAEPGEVCISASVFDQVKRKLDAAFDDLGEQALKNIAEPVRVYRLRPLPGGHIESVIEPTPPRLPAKPSLAVLPFTNMSGDREQDVFADGLTEDLITDLSRNEGLFVIARHSTFAYKAKAIDVRQIARELGVRYVLEGSARRLDGRVRINVQLIDATGGDHLWAERFDRSVEDIFSVQDEVTGKIVEALVGRLTTLPARSRPKNLEAYELCLRARPLIAHLAGSAEAIRECEILLREAVTIEPDYAEAMRWLAFTLWSYWAHSIGSPETKRLESIEFALRSVELDPNDAGNHWVVGYLQAYERRWAESEAAFAAALALDPNHADTLVMSAEMLMWDGRIVEARDMILRAFRLNPHPAGWYFWILGMVHYAAGRYDAAIDTLRNEATYRSGSRKVLAAALALVDRDREARREANIFIANNPQFSLGRWAASQPARHLVVVQHFVEGMRKAGLPD
ncbi:adenylate/guanylate cyclase domain-containing protein [Mesorhizobium sp. M4B.F.Ca.ET.089.01.1.1]|uniref:adenylate/guanylate cyclase domain-containing protein n=1 Tax=Mesorhizobium sp. M4B.F.Ca.ET.089.01.1.1 TaxID=2496662 RepID=UPI000FE39E54|nr:adenylate/guanylate cyclase domain-containing protein [Mesorhizobium sp. M4B.F.Ca.ET.089.01.1.1]RWX71289.1 adenylate/guanylate cyclase domain-containing protein [Mesorhizobium sp. M4B.F.Ca.ET.089.01.1.1]